MQFINRPYETLSPWHRMIAHYIDPPLPEGVDDPTINVVPFPSKFEDGKAVFPAPPKHRAKETGWKDDCRPDLVVLCTGYRQDWSWLGDGYPRGPDECDVRGVCSSKDPSIAFIGFLRPGVGKSIPHTLSVLSEPPIAFISASVVDMRRCILHRIDADSTQVRSRQWRKCKCSSSSFSPQARFPHPRPQRRIISSIRQLRGFSTG